MDLIDARLHACGSSHFIDDEPRPEGLLFAAVYPSPVAHGQIKSIDISAAQKSPGVVAVLLAQDVPELYFGTIVQDERVLALDVVEYVGEPIALVVADSRRHAHKALQEIKVDIESLPVITDPREAFRQGHILGQPREFKWGEPERAWSLCDIIVQGQCDIGGQEHVYLETQRCRAVPLEAGRMRIFSSTQGPGNVQRNVARILGLQQNDIEVDVRRLGGGFGGKEDQATLWACLAGLAAWRTQKPVELVLSRSQDLRMTGKRHPYSADFRMGLTKDGMIIAYEATFYQNAGCTTDLSPAILERTLFHCTNAYHVPHGRCYAVSCRTHLPSNTAFRGFGGPQGMFVIEAAIARAAEVLGTSREEIQRKNLLQNGDVFPYGQKVANDHQRSTWSMAEKNFEYDTWQERVHHFNQDNSRYKKGLAIMPLCFGISFTNTMLNQGGALVHVYLDGGVAITIGGVEMGQGLYTKIIEIARRTLGVHADRIKCESTNSSRVANSSPTAASASTDLYGYAVLDAIAQIQQRLLGWLAKEQGWPVEEVSVQNEMVLLRGQATSWTWPKLVQAAYVQRIGLSAIGFYATPDIYFDKTKEKGHPFRYHVTGVAMIEVTLDGLRGTYVIERVKILHGMNESLNERIDRGQIEGGLAQGLGWMTLEELCYNDKGRLLSDSLSTYKVPDVYFMPDDLEIQFAPFIEKPAGPLASKAVGEPPLMYGIGVFFALRKAMQALRTDLVPAFHTPVTPEQVLMQLYG
jgi:xanthine dehydrogenase large subunit